MKVKLSEIDNLKVPARARKIPYGIWEFIASIMSQYALSNFQGDIDDSIIRAMRGYFAGGEILAKDLIQKKLIQNSELLALFDEFPKIESDNSYNFVIWSEFLDSATWESNDNQSIFEINGNSYSMGQDLLTLECIEENYIAKRLHCEKDGAYFERIGPGSTESDKTPATSLPLFAVCDIEDKELNQDEETNISEEDFFFLDDSLQKADEQQREAITSGTQDNLVVLAGAGSGKTRTLVARFAFLHVVKKVPLRKILLLTFTKNAATEMRIRSKDLIEKIYSGFSTSKKIEINARTIDSFMMGLVEAHYPQMGFLQKPVMHLGNNKEVRQQKVQLIETIIRENNLEGIFRNYFDENGKIKGNLNYLLRDLLDFACGLPINCAGFEFLLKQYMNKQREAGIILGFTEASLFVKEAVSVPDSSVKESILSRYSCILIDEFQDVNVLQNQIFSEFYNTSIHFTFVGDDDQSIYYWRGSNNTIIKGFVDQPGFQTTYLLTNYRNNPNIVEAGNAVLRTIPNRAKKNKPIKANRETGEKIRVTQYNAKFTNLVNEINNLMQSGQSADEISILYRNRDTGDKIRRELTAANIPVASVSNSINIDDNYKLMKSIINILNSCDIVVSVKEICRITGAENVTERHVQKVVLGECSEADCEQELAKVRDLSNELRYNIIPDMANAVDRYSIKAGELFEGSVNQHHSDEVFDQFAEFCRNNDAPWRIRQDQLNSLFSTFEDTANNNLRRAKEYTPGVRLSTIHSAKGLEYNVVIITGLNDGEYPNTEQIDRIISARNEQLKTFQDSRQCFYQLRSEMEPGVHIAIMRECDDPSYNREEKEKLQDFQSEVYYMGNSLQSLSADGITEYLDAYRYHVQPLIKQYDDYILNKNKEQLIKKSEIEGMEEKILISERSDPDQAIVLKNQLGVLRAEENEIAETADLIQKKKARFLGCINSICKFYSICLTASGLLADMGKADEIEELQEKLKVEREQRIDEERRLFYVAVTRARDFLYLCYAEGSQPSIFIRLIPENLKADHVMLTREEESEHRRLADALHKETEKVRVNNEKIDQQTQQILSQDKFSQYILKRTEEFDQEHPIFVNLTTEARNYYDKAIGLLFVSELTGGDFKTEFAHNMQRMAETILREMAGKDADPFKTLDLKQIDRITDDIMRISKRCVMSKPGARYIKKLITEPDQYGDQLKLLKSLGIMHYIIRSGKYAIPINVMSTWRFTTGLSRADRFLVSALDLSNVRNTLIHDDPSKWPEDPIPVILKYAENIVFECQDIWIKRESQNSKVPLEPEYIKAGTKVRHKDFGLGMIVDVLDDVFTVSFAGDSKKTFMKRTAKNAFIVI